MFTIEEAKAARPAAQYTIPTGAKREFGDDALKRDIEGQVSEQDARAVATLGNAVSTIWQKITGNMTSESGTQRTAE